MKQAIKCILTATILACCCSSVFSQDKLYFKGNDVPIECEIDDIEGTSVFYTPRNSDGTFGGIERNVDRSEFDKIVFENGDVLESKDIVSADEYYLYHTDNKRNALKFNLVSPLYNSIVVAYEHGFKPNRSIDVSLGYIGIGADAFDEETNEWDFSDEPRGIIAKVGLKFKKNRDYYNLKEKYRPMLKGGYVKPELCFSMYTRDVEVFDHNEGKEIIYKDDIETSISYGLMVKGGYQWVVNRFTLDLYGGLGYGLGNETYYGHLQPSNGISIIFDFGINMGFTF